jgi:hypothetical protein
MEGLPEERPGLRIGELIHYHENNARGFPPKQSHLQRRDSGEAASFARSGASAAKQARLNTDFTD